MYIQCILTCALYNYVQNSFKINAEVLMYSWDQQWVAHGDHSVGGLHTQNWSTTLYNMNTSGALPGGGVNTQGRWKVGCKGCGYDVPCMWLVLQRIITHHTQLAAVCQNTLFRNTALSSRGLLNFCSGEGHSTSGSHFWPPYGSLHVWPAVCWCSQVWHTTWSETLLRVRHYDHEPAYVVEMVII